MGPGEEKADWVKRVLGIDVFSGAASPSSPYQKFLSDWQAALAGLVTTLDAALASFVGRSDIAKHGQFKDILKSVAMIKRSTPVFSGEMETLLTEAVQLGPTCGNDLLKKIASAARAYKDRVGQTEILARFERFSKDRLGADCVLLMPVHQMLDRIIATCIEPEIQR